MTGDEFASITRGLVRRGWNEIEPKVAYTFASGGLFGILVTILSSYGVPITPEVKSWGPYLVGVLGGYLFPSSGQIVTVRASADQRTVTTQTKGAVETIVTGAIPVQRTAPNVPLSDLIKSRTNEQTPVFGNQPPIPYDPNGPTQKFEP